jgi:hypothetical protein
MARYRDFDAALDRRGPLQFTLAGHTWTIQGLGLRPVAAVMSKIVADDDGDDSMESTLAMFLAIGEFFEAVVDDPDLWREKTPNVGVNVLKDLLEWVVAEEVGMPATPAAGDDADPLARPPVLSALSPQNGRSSAGGSPPLVSSTQ